MFISARRNILQALLPVIVLASPALQAQRLAPEESLAAMRIDPRFTISLFAAEPDVIDPVAITFDETGRMYVCEMRVMEELPATEPGTQATIRLLEDRDQDGRADHSVIFAEGLSFPSGIAPFKRGVYALCSPELLYLKDTDGDDRADVRRVIRTGFAQGNAEHRFNNLTWHFDNMIYAANGGGGGALTDPGDPSVPKLDLSGCDLAFDPWSGIARSLTRHTGGGFGLAFDDWGRRFVCDNERHCTMIILPQRYLENEPSLPVRSASLDISEDPSPDDPVYPISSPQDWRIERTDRRARNESSRFRPTQLKANGYFTAACGSMVYRGGGFPDGYEGNLFVCDAAQNLVHRSLLVEDGVKLIARRADEETEFLRSMETWFRPVNLTTGPDGAIYVADFHREIIETGASIPPDILARLDLRAGGDMGRIYRIAPKAGLPQPVQPPPASLDDATLVKRLESSNAWHRLTAQRLLIERQALSVVPAIAALADSAPDPRMRLHALWILNGLGRLDGRSLIPALESNHPRLREQALILAERAVSKR